MASRGDFLAALKNGGVTVIEITAENLDKMRNPFVPDLDVGNMMWTIGDAGLGVAYFWPDHGGPATTVVRLWSRPGIVEAFGNAVIENGAPFLRTDDGGLVSLLTRERLP